MKKKECIVNVYLLNEHFSPEYAEAQHNGKESENNLRYEWEDEFAITSDVLSVTAIEDASFPLQGEMPDGQIFSHEVTRMLLFEIASADAPTTFVGASARIVDSYEIDQSGKDMRLKIFLKDYEPMSNPIPGIYIASKEFPKELIF
ncbi:MAG: hypothetical protein ACK5FX_04780 [Flavobacteriia bacterium]|jgi:hypothetical protein